MNCKNCIHWKNQQADLGYISHRGFCTAAQWSYDVRRDKDIMVFDRENKVRTNATKSHRFESQRDTIPFGQVEHSRYVLVTDENFGCIHFKDKTV